MLVHPSSIDLSSRTPRFLTGQLTARRQETGTRRRRLPAGRQALLALARLRCGDTYAQLAAGFGIGIATVYRYIREAVEALAALAPSLDQTMTTIRTKAFVILDGTLLSPYRAQQEQVLAQRRSQYFQPTWGPSSLWHTTRACLQCKRVLNALEGFSSNLLHPYRSEEPSRSDTNENAQAFPNIGIGQNRLPAFRKRWKCSQPGTATGRYGCVSRP